MGVTPPASGPPAGPATAPALWRDLLLRLGLPLLLIVGATAAAGLFTAQRFTDDTFDRWLLDSARALARQVRFVGADAVVELGHDAEAILSYDVIDTTWFAVRQGNRLVAGLETLPARGDGATVYADGQVYDAQVIGRRVRVARVEVGSAAAPAVVLVAETRRKRSALASELRWSMLPIALAMLLATAAAIVLALRRTIVPLERIAAQWNARSHASLQEIGLHGVPRELLPFATALNALLQRMQGVLQRERRFAANAAHQIRTPLAGLQLGLSRAADAPDLAATRAVIADLQQSTQRTARLLQQLLALGRLDPEAAHDLDRQATDLGALAHDVGALSLDAALARGSALELIAPDRPVLATVQAELVGEALGNLIDNALRYAGPGCRVEITVRDDPPSLEVGDSGPGLAEDERVAVLDRFVRGRAATGDGSGLGLAIVREIAELHGATLALGQSVLGGLSVRLAFPPAQVDAAALSSGSGPRPSAA